MITQDLTISQLRSKKVQLEESINALLNEFISQTGMRISDIDVKQAHIWMGQDIIVPDYRIEVELEFK